MIVTHPSRSRHPTATVGHEGSRRRCDAGKISVFVAAAMPAMITFLGLMWDASGYLRTLHRLDNIAAEAARTAGQQINVPLAIADGIVEVDPDAAVAAVAEYTAEAGFYGEVDVATDQQEVTVTITADWQPDVLGVFGFGPRTLSGQATAHLIQQ